MRAGQIGGGAAGGEQQGWRMTGTGPTVRPDRMRARMTVAHEITEPVSGECATSSQRVARAASGSPSGAGTDVATGAGGTASAGPQPARARSRLGLCHDRRLPPRFRLEGRRFGGPSRVRTSRAAVAARWAPRTGATCSVSISPGQSAPSPAGSNNGRRQAAAPERRRRRVRRGRAGSWSSAVKDRRGDRLRPGLGEHRGAAGHVLQTVQNGPGVLEDVDDLDRDVLVRRGLLIGLPVRFARPTTTTTTPITAKSPTHFFGASNTGRAGNVREMSLVPQRIPF